ncbi:TetR/AcrR family transcriptional regulator [Microtetraspora sp. AC03309]|uniref:TetR/AcrR family transcriptional regulator n=1 Tax=Microtetraspora sp. AC03309 TaxID=2779376 RepID=UPI001E4F778E|nr:TetR/AcrR family transcriptional regulator [Microtetraspora sp. AC03309]MCC5581466.1 TetR/AcrR family transcriptional regulator [Microtetraspora sp. AC03309]
MADRHLPPGAPPPPWRTPAKAAPSKPPLTQELIVRTALEIVDREGLDALSMRRVAQELETGSASLYVYVANKDELLELLIDHVFGEVSVPKADPARWQEQIKELAFALRRALTDHADIARIGMAYAPCGPNGLWVAEGFLAILRSAGLPDQVCGWAVDRLTLYVTADALEVSHHIVRGRATQSDVEAYWRRVGDYYASLPKEHFPHTTAMVDSLLAGSDSTRFEFGLDLFLYGLKNVDRIKSTLTEEPKKER